MFEDEEGGENGDRTSSSTKGRESSAPRQRPERGIKKDSRH